MLYHDDKYRWRDGYQVESIPSANLTANVRTHSVNNLFLLESHRLWRNNRSFIARRKIPSHLHFRVFCNFCMGILLSKSRLTHSFFAAADWFSRVFQITNELTTLNIRMDCGLCDFSRQSHQNRVLHTIKAPQKGVQHTNYTESNGRLSSLPPSLHLHCMSCL